MTITSSLLTPPTFDDIVDPIARHKQLVLYWMLLALNVLHLIVFLISFPISAEPIVAIVSSVVTQILLASGVVFVRRGYGNTVGIIHSVMLTFLLMGIVPFTKGPPAFLQVLIMPLIFASFVANPAYIWLLGGLQTVGIITIFVTLDAERINAIPIHFYITTVAILVLFAFYSHLNTHIQRTYITQLFELNKALEDANQQEIALRQEAEQASQAKSHFLASMSHELRTPLNAILGYSEMVQEDLEDTPGVSTESINDMTKIHRAGKHLLTLISNVLDMSKIEAGHMEVDPSSFNLDALLKEIHALTAPLAAQKQNQLNLNVPRQTIEMHTDRTKLKQILLNLISNASKFTQDGQITLTTTVHGDHVTLDVEDNGIGIEPEALEKIFDAFTQADNSTTRHYGGTGLGLTLCEHFVVMLKGSISARSTPGEGSTFTIEIPIHYDDVANEEDSAHTV